MTTDPDMGLVNIQQGLHHLYAAAKHFELAKIKCLPGILRDLAAKVADPLPASKPPAEGADIISMASGERLNGGTSQ